MNKRSLVMGLLLSLVAAALSGCAGSKPKDQQSRGRQNQLPAYFEEIPADTLFFAGGSQPIPRPLVARSLKFANVVFHWSEAISDGELSKKLAGYLMRGTNPADKPTADAPRKNPPNVFRLFLDEMSGQLSADGLEKIGLSSSPRVAAYALGTIPVVRVELGDQKKFLSFVDRLEKAYGLTPDHLEQAGVAYRRYSPTVGSDTILVRTTANEVIVARPPNKKAADIFLPYFVGAKKPEKSLADDNAFLRTVETHGFQRFGGAYLDLQRLVGYATGTIAPQKITGKLLAATHFEMTSTPACQKESVRMSKMVPRVVAGFRHSDQHTVDVAFGAELDEAISRELAGAVSGVPGYNTAFAENSLLQIGWGINADKMSKALAGVARKIQMQPFQCSSFEDINTAASRTLQTTGQLPEAVTKLTGFNLLLRNIIPEWAPNGTTSGATNWIPRILGAIRTGEPQAFMYLVRQFFPAAKQLAVKPNGKPVPIPQLAGISGNIIAPALLMTANGLAITAGPDMTRPARTVVNAAPVDTSRAFVAQLNLGDPARELVADLKSLVDKAAASQQARGLTDADIDGARRAISTIEAFLPDGPWSATFGAELNEYGVFFSYKKRGKLNLDAVEDLHKSLLRAFESMGRVLGQDPTPARGD